MCSAFLFGGSYFLGIENIIFRALGLIILTCGVIGIGFIIGMEGINGDNNESD